MMLMDKLRAAAANGASVDIYWFYDVEDDTIQELGEEFRRGLRECQVPP
jgi:SiaC family regulatory phosphoprotein